MPRDMSGSFRKNDKKTAPNHPDIKGAGVYHGEEFWLAAWKKEVIDQEGITHIYYSFELTPKDKPKEKPQEPRVQQPISDDEVPF